MDFCLFKTFAGDDSELGESVGRAGLQYTSSKASEKKNAVSCWKDDVY